MNTYPLIRNKGSNEHVMAALFGVLVLYHIPLWLKQPYGLLSFVFLIATGFLIDAVAAILRHKKLWCCISAGITAAMISFLTPGVPLWCQLIGVVAALLLGKHSFGGTGRNLTNPAMVGLLVILLFREITFPFPEGGYLLLPATLFGLGFLILRPYAGICFLFGSVLVLLITRELSLLGILGSGALFWGSLVITDPVTVTRKPLAGSLLGFVAGVGIVLDPRPVTYVAVILLINLISYALELLPDKDKKPLKAGFRIPKEGFKISDEVIDLTGEGSSIKASTMLTGEGSSTMAGFGLADGSTVIVGDDPSELSRKVILKRIKEHEVFGMGGAAFSTYHKLETLINAQVTDKYLIINGVECDPGLIHDHYLLRNHVEEISKGVELLQRCANFQSVILAVKELTGLSFTNTDIIKLHKVPDKYPMGAERILIQEVLNRKLESGQIPAAQGILVLNAQTIYSIYTSVYLNRKADIRLLTVADMRKAEARIVKVRLGMRLQEIIEAVYPGSIRCFAGGGAMQAYSVDEDSIVDKTVNFIATGVMPKYKESPQCSGCGECSDRCPAGLKVYKIAELVDKGRAKDTLKYHPSDCILCGSCSYTCKAGRNLTARMKIAKEAIR